MKVVGRPPIFSLFTVAFDSAGNNPGIYKLISEEIKREIEEKFLNAVLCLGETQVLLYEDPRNFQYIRAYVVYQGYIYYVGRHYRHQTWDDLECLLRKGIAIHRAVDEYAKGKIGAERDVAIL